MLPRDTATCPKCRKTFQIPQNGVDSLQRHFIVQRLADKERERIRLQSFCDEHKDEQQRMYCYDCKDNICLICLRKKHRSHNWDFIPEVADIFRLRIHDDVQQVQSATSSVREKAELDTAKFCSDVEAVKKQILAMDDITKRSVDNQVSDLLTKLQFVNSESSKWVENVKLASFTKVEEFYTDLQKLLDGRPIDITGAASKLRDRATELLNSVTAVKYCPPHVTFTPADVTQVQHLSLIGELTVATDQQPGMPFLLYWYRQSLYIM